MRRKGYSRQRPKTREKDRYVTVKYSFTLHGRRIPCCKKFLLDTLGIGKRKVEYMVKNLSSHGTPKSDERGKNQKANATDEATNQRIREHIASFPTIPSHYCRKSSKRTFLSSNLSVHQMHEIYKNAERKAKRSPKEIGSLKVYRRIFNTEFNLAFKKPKKDLCGFCFNMGHASAKDKLQLKTVYEEHILKKEECRAAYQREKENAKNNPLVFHTASFDLEKVLLCPEMNVEDLYLTVEM